MANGYCDAKFCRKTKAAAYSWGQGEYELCEGHILAFCRTDCTEAAVKVSPRLKAGGFRR